METQITLKITFEKEIRRLTVNSKLSWEGLQRVLHSVFKTHTDAQWSRTIVRYLDDEGDHCTISSDEELREAISLSTATTRPILRLVLVEEKPQTLPLTALRAATPTQPQTLPLTELRAPAPTSDLGGDLIRAIIDTSEKISNTAPHLCTEILNSLTSTLQSAISVPAEQPTGSGNTRGWGFHRQHIKELGNEGIALMDSQDYFAAREKFMQQLSLIKRPWHRSTPLYNIACCDSLLGDHESALSFLEQAINAGYRDVEHMKSDADLDNIRNLERFSTLLETAAQQSPSHPNMGRCCPGFSRYRQGWFELQQQALALMEDSKNPESLKQARELLEKQIKLSPNPWGQRIPLYNIACCEALLGNTDEALSFLQSSVNAGYRNLRHIEGDADLDSLRDTEAYKQIIASIKSGHRNKGWWKFGFEPAEENNTEQPEPEKSEPELAQPEPVAEPEPVPEPEPVADPAPEPVAEPAPEPEQPEEPASEESSFAVPPEFEHFASQLEILAQMGFLELTQNLTALVSTRGDVTRAIEKLLQ